MILAHQKSTNTSELKSQQGLYKTCKRQLGQSRANRRRLKKKNLGLEKELVNLQQKNFQFEQDLTVQAKEFAEKENTLQAQITNLQNEKQALVDNLTEQLKQTSQLNQENNNLQNQLVQSKTNIQELKSQQQIEEEQNKLQNIQVELVNLQQRNFQFEQDLTVQAKEFAEKENTLQAQITNLQNEKQALVDNLTEQLKQTTQLNQENNNLQNQLVLLKTNIQELKSQQQIEEEQNKLQNIQVELVNLQQRNFQFEQDNQKLRLNLAVQAKEFAEKENTLQAQITNLQNEKQALVDNLTEQLKQTTQLNQENNNLQNQLVLLKTNIQELKSQQQIEEEQNKLQNIQVELVNLQQRNFQFEQDNQKLRLNLAVQAKEFAEKENTLQAQITNLQNEKQALVDNLTEQLKQTTQLNQENNNLQNQLVLLKTNIQELKSQQQIEEEQNKLQNIQVELVNLQQRNIQFEQDNQKLRLNLAVQIKEFAEKENILQTQITHLSEKQSSIGNLTEFTNQQVQIQINQIEQEKIDLQKRLTQIEVKIRELRSYKESLIKQMEQLENRINQFQVNGEQIKQKRIRLQNIEKDFIKLDKEIDQLEQKLNNEKQIKMQLTQALQIKENKINELEKKLVAQECIKQLKDKEKELSEIEKELINKLTLKGNTKGIYKEKKAKQKEINELKQKFVRTTASYNANKEEQVLIQVNQFLKVKNDFLTLQEEAIKKLQNCCNHLKSLINIKNNNTTIDFIKNTVNVESAILRYTKEFQITLIKYNDRLLKLNKVYYFLKNIIQGNKGLEVSLMIENILKLNSFNLDKYNVFKFTINSQEEFETQLNSNMIMVEDIKSLRKNLHELKLELKQEKEELKNLAID
ncbi:unnamed protein product [Rhizophagus irregularis]|nr:unnamed protein product [Rhizophagus irregularis]